MANLKKFSFYLVLFANLWIWKAAASNPMIAVLMLISSFALYYSIKFRSLYFLLAFIVLLALQFTTTKNSSLINLDNDQKRIQAMRLQEYPPVKISFFDKTLWLPVAHWFEGRKETIAAFRIVRNFSENIDPNLYFFANHPRQRAGIQEFEKFPYLFFPFFIFGILSSIGIWNRRMFFLPLLVPLLLTSFIGNDNSLGPFSIFPFVVVATSQGLIRLASYFKNKIVYILSLGFLFINFLQALSYALH